MKRMALVAAGALALAACQDVLPPTALETPGEALLARSSAATVDVIVELRVAHAPGGHGANAARAGEVARGLGLTPSHTYGSALFGFAASVPEARLHALRNDPRVARVDFDAPVSVPQPRVDARPSAKPGSGTGSAAQLTPWGVRRIGAEVNANEGAGIHVYVLDTGIDSDHPDLAANLGNGYAAVACRGGGCLQPWDDDHDHGTHVAGTIGAIDNAGDVLGVASRVTLHAVKVLDRNGSGTRSGIVAGLDWMTREVVARGRPAVANMSLGGSGSKSGSCSSAGYAGSDSYHQAICNATRAGVVFAVAAGNSGVDARGAVPAAYDDAVITVSATRCALSGQSCTQGSDDWTSWSNWGNTPAVWGTLSVTHAPVAIAAPGASILSTRRGGGTVSMSGTSMAAPHVAGAIALYLAKNALPASYAAFESVRAGLLSAAESTGAWTNTSGNPHAEKLANVQSF